MFKSLLAGLALFLAAGVASALDVNRATQAELESVKGIGSGISTKILDERKKGSFKDWADLIDRVQGVGEGNAAKFSAEGLTVGGAGYKGVAAAPAAPKAAAKPAAAAAAATTTAKDAKEPAMAASPKGDKPVAAKDAKSEPAMAKAAKDEKAPKEDKAAAKASKDDDKAKKAVDDKKAEDKPKKS